MTHALAPTCVRRRSDSLVESWADFPTAHENAPLTAVVSIEGMPKRLRPDVEQLMVECIPSPSELVVRGADPFEAQWFTQWTRSQGTPGLIECRQLITATAEELRSFKADVASLAEFYGFDASVREVG